MKKSVLFLALIAFIFASCEPQKDVDYVNQNVYGVWVAENEGFYSSNDERDDLLYIINEENTKFISNDSIIIYHGCWEYSDASDLGYRKYKYEVIKEEKLKLTGYNGFSNEDFTIEFNWKSDLLPSAEKYITEKKKKNLEYKGFLGKWEWISTENLDSNDVTLAKHVIDTLENSIIEIRTNTFITLDGGGITYNGINYSTYTMQPYTAIITKKNVGVIDDKILIYILNYPLNDGSSREALIFFFPEYSNGEYTGFMNHLGGTHYDFSFENNKLILKDSFSNVLLTFQKIE